MPWTLMIAMSDDKKEFLILGKVTLSPLANSNYDFQIFKIRGYLKPIIQRLYPKSLGIINSRA